MTLTRSVSPTGGFAPLIASKRIRLDSRCRYRVRFTNVTRSRLRGATRVSVTVRSGRRTATHRVSVPKR